MTTATPTELYSLGHMAAMLQRTPRTIEKAAAELGLLPSLVLNGVRHWSTEALEQLMQHFREVAK